MIDEAQLEEVETRDGSPTLRRTDLGVTYRSRWGAVTEANYVFLHATDLASRPGPWRVVELGFGLGTTFGLTHTLAQKTGVALHYLSVERDPVPSTAIPDKQPAAEISRQALAELRAGASYVQVESDGTTLTVMKGVWPDLELPLHHSAHAVFFDPFGPRTEPESWKVESFRLAASVLVSDGILATYSAATRVKQAMLEAGLQPGTLPGPPGKREITVASPSANALGDATLYVPGTTSQPAEET